MKATILHARHPAAMRGWTALSRREILVVSGVLVSLTAYLSALLLLV